MADVINALPGIEMPVGEVVKQLATMWEGGPGGSPSEFHASQMNLVLHLGLDVNAEEARERFDAAIHFSQRYPSRIIILCPNESDDEVFMKSKLFTQCYIGDSHREMCCCEALLLSYKPNDLDSLSNQVSVWLESDLPVYHWFNRLPSNNIETYFDNLLQGARRIVFDSSIEDEDVKTLEWPEPDRVRDLAMARLLPVRQAIGQFMSGFKAEELRGGLQTVLVTHCPTLSGEGCNILEWAKSCLQDCVKKNEEASGDVEFELKAAGKPDSECALRMEWTYKDDRYFKWVMYKHNSLGEIRTNLSKHDETIPTSVKLLSPERALSEALFF
jgi:glucose-6-phosphate dehydrogenase assembly protein OpcA